MAAMICCRHWREPCLLGDFAPLSRRESAVVTASVWTTGLLRRTAVAMSPLTVRNGRRLAAQSNFNVLAAGRRSTRPLERYARLFDDWLTSRNALCGNRMVRLPKTFGCTEVWLS